MDVLSSRILLRVPDVASSVHWYREVLGLHIAREYGTGGKVTGVVFFLGGGFLEITAGATPHASEGSPDLHTAALWLQVADVDAEHQRLAAAGVDVLREPQTEPWGLRECWVADPDGLRIVLIQVPDAHPLRRRVD